MDKNKIEIKDLYLIFGSERNKAFKMLKKGKSKSELLKETGCTVAVNNASLSVREGEIFVIMGLSGSGKSSLLRCINRLNRPTSGEILINGEDIAGVPDERLRSLRRKELAMVFQHFGLMPHYTVLQNIAFGLELQGQEKREREQKAAESMRLVGLDGYADLMVNELSGGMQQRVGLARALANDPEVLLMDEAFSALDPLIRVQMQDELLALQSKVKKTIVFITHDLEEAVKLGDRIAIMRDGEIQQIGTSEVLIRKMRERKITVLPVVDPDGILVGEVHLKELLQLRKERILNIDSIVRKEVHSILGDTVVEDILPLMTKTNSPIWVVNEKREFEGMVPLSSLIIEVTGKDKEEINEIIQNAIEL